MKRSLLSLVVASAAVSVLMPATASAVATPEYTTYVGCGTGASAAPSHECELGASPGAFFESNEEVEFDVCVEFPSTEVLCAEEQLAQAGVLYVNKITTDEVGTHNVHWYLTGTEEEIGSWSFAVKEPPPPAPSPPSTITVPVVVPTVVPVPVVVPTRVPSACTAARKRVRNLQKRLRHASPEQKPKLRGKLRKARAAVRRAC